ncbi:gamma-glutamyl-gamma-aminobutyrate hydrolase family protein [Microbacterium sediminicola]|uniref:Gamma-glutamyl-gamma-aminobutyrate hydrolase family protein n=1 Tax=Microbacterium sediminicola TaxID=415210 RepID=A0ABP4UIT2_9MICO
MTRESSPAAPVLVVDNHDSFVHTLVGYLHELGATTRLVEADELAALDRDLLLGAVSGILISPGPGAPDDVPESLALVREAVSRGIPMLGVCLGHQVMAQALGARVSEAPELFHGVTSEVWHDGSSLFEGIPSPFTATRYHSLAVDADTLPRGLIVTGRTSTGVIMSFAHAEAPAWAVQFHPESVLTEGGYRLLANWLEHTGVIGAVGRAATLRPHMT